jgi:hypothetical protein
MEEVLVATDTGRAASSAPEGVSAFRGWLSSVDVGRLTDRERIDLVAELERVKGTAAAAQARATHALRESRQAVAPRDVSRSVGSEVALARRQSPTLGDRYVGLARALVTEMPQTLRSLERGECSERHALALVQVTSVLSVEHRALVDRRVGPLLARLGVVGAERAARRVAAELDAAAVVRRMEDAVRSRRVTVRPAPDGMAYLSVLGPMVEVVGAHAALRRRSQAVVGGLCPEELPEGRGAGAVAADTALRLLSGRAHGEPQPVEVHLVMTDRALLGAGDTERSTSEPARIPGIGSLPASVARARLRGSATEGSAPGTARDDGSVWLRRLYTTPEGRDLVAMDSRRRTFSGLLRRMLVLRDDVCTTPWCESPIAHADHTHPARDDGDTSFHNGRGRCARCNYGKEAPGWATHVAPAVATAPEAVTVTTPLGRRYASTSPPLLGWGSVPSPGPMPRRNTYRPDPGPSSVDRERRRALRGAETRVRRHRYRGSRELLQHLCRWVT